MKKVVLVWVGGIFVVIIALVVAAGLFIGPIIKAGVETLGPKIMRVPVTLESVVVSLPGGSASINGLNVGNPEGYTSSGALRLGSAAVSLEVMSVFSEKIHLRSVLVDSLEVTYDGGLTGESNLGTIMNNVNASAGKTGKASGVSGQGKEESAGKPAPKIQLDDLLIKGVKVHVNLRGISSKTMTMSLPDIHLTGLGKDTGGMTPEDLIQTVLGQVTGSTLEAVKGSLLDTGKALKGLGKELEKEAGTSLKALKEGLGGLFGK
jgi:hypothetical protein